LNRPGVKGRRNTTAYTKKEGKRRIIVHEPVTEVGKKIPTAATLSTAHVSQGKAGKSEEETAKRRRVPRRIKNSNISRKEKKTDS